jgi:hypothetical protein
MRGGLFLLLVIAGCVTPRLDDPPLAMEMVVVGLRPDERVELRDRLCAIEGVTDCKMIEEAPPPPPKKKGKKKEPEAPPPPSHEVRYTFSFRGSLGNLRWRIQQLPHPGLEAQRADVRLSYRGFDNKPPSIELVEPPPDRVLTEHVVTVVVRVPDVDTQAVDIGDEDGTHQGDRYQATVRELPEGASEVVVKATDHAGNSSELAVKVDTTPPDLEVEVEVPKYDHAIVRGKAKDAAKLTVDGRDVPVDMFGSFQKDIAVDPDTSYVEIVAVDEHGNAKKIKRSVKIASPLSSDSK